MANTELWEQIKQTVAEQINALSETCKPNCKENLAKNCDCYFADCIKMTQQ